MGNPQVKSNIRQITPFLSRQILKGMKADRFGVRFSISTLHTCCFICSFFIKAELKEKNENPKHSLLPHEQLSTKRSSWVFYWLHYVVNRALGLMPSCEIPHRSAWRTAVLCPARDEPPVLSSFCSAGAGSCRSAHSSVQLSWVWRNNSVSFSVGHELAAGNLTDYP